MQSILVIDDQVELRTTLQVALDAAGYKVRVATNGEEALAGVDETNADLVITDLIMPGKNGVEVALELRKKMPGLPVIVMTGGEHLDPNYYLKIARSLGAKGILHKPFSNEQLLLTVALALPPEA